MTTRIPYTTVNVQKALYQQLTELARRNDRSASAEARIAIRRHLENERAINKDMAWLKESA